MPCALRIAGKSGGNPQPLRLGVIGSVLGDVGRALTTPATSLPPSSLPFLFSSSFAFHLSSLDSDCASPSQHLFLGCLESSVS